MILCPASVTFAEIPHIGSELVRADIGNMHIDPLPEDIRVYLKAHFTDVEDELQQGDYYVFGLKTTSGLPRRLKASKT